MDAARRVQVAIPLEPAAGRGARGPRSGLWPKPGGRPRALALAGWRPPDCGVSAIQQWRRLPTIEQRGSPSSRSGWSPPIANRWVRQRAITPTFIADGGYRARTVAERRLGGPRWLKGWQRPAIGVAAGLPARFGSGIPSLAGPPPPASRGSRSRISAGSKADALPLGRCPLPSEAEWEAVACAEEAPGRGRYGCGDGSQERDGLCSWQLWTAAVPTALPRASSSGAVPWANTTAKFMAPRWC